MQRVALVVGVTGVIGRQLIKVLLSRSNPNWSKVYAISRHPLEESLEQAGLGPASTYRSDLDLSRLQILLADAGDTAQVLSHSLLHDPPEPISALFMCAFEDEPFLLNAIKLARTSYGPANDANADERMRTSLHVQIVTGARIYSLVDKTDRDALEFEEEVLVRGQGVPEARQKFLNENGYLWACGTIAGVLGPTVGRGWSFPSPLYIYASVLKALGRPLIFPGNPGALKYGKQFSSLYVLPELYEKLALNSLGKKGGSYYNVFTAEFTWKDVWPTIANYFGMEVEYPCERNPEQTFNVKEFVATAEALATWKALVEQQGLRCSNDLSSVASWGYFTQFLMTGRESRPFSCKKLVQSGLFPPERLEAESFWKATERAFGEMRANRLVPDPALIVPLHLAQGTGTTSPGSAHS